MGFNSGFKGLNSSPTSFVNISNHVKFNLKEEDYLGDLGMEGKIIISE